MKIGERFNDMINMIENTVLSEQYVKAPEIKAETARHCGLNLRDINTIFTYLTNYSLLDYIRGRQLMAAYTLIVNMEEFDIEKAIVISGYDNQSSFGKKFKEIFGVSPGNAFRKKDKTKIVGPLTWDAITNGEGKMNNTLEHPAPQKMIYGLPESQYLKLQEVFDLQALYELSEEQSNLIYYISEEDNIPLKRAFAIAADYIDWEGEFDVFGEDMEKARITTGLTAEFIYVYGHVTKNIRDAKVLIKKVHACGYDTSTISAELLKYYLRNTSFSFSEFMHLAEIYGMNIKRDVFDDECEPFEVGYDYEPDNYNPYDLEEDDFMAYLDRVRDGETPEEAICEEYYDYD